MPSLKEEAAFTGPEEVLSFAGILSDMDGTIIDSTDAIVKHWHKIGKELGVDPNVILASAHGRRSIDTIQEYDPTKANWEYVSHIEGLIPREFGADAIEVPGARHLLASLEAVDARWAIVTSATRALVSGWLDVMKLPAPKYLVVAEDVEAGKPAPDCYLLGKDRLGLNADAKVLVVEDAPAGIRAGKAAGCAVIALATTHDIQQLKSAGANWIIRDLRSIKHVGRDAETGDVKIQICNTWGRP